MSARTLVLVVISMLAVAPLARAQPVAIGMDQFDSWMFNRLKNETAARAAFRDRIDLEVEQLANSADLDDRQVAKIRLAGKGDIKRFFDDVNQARRKFLAMGNLHQNQVNEAYQLAMPLAQRIGRGLFDKDSLLKKVANTTPNPQQTARLRERAEHRQKRQREIAINSYVAMLGRSIPLTSDQRGRLTEHIAESVVMDDPGAPYASQLIAYRLSQGQTKKLQEIFDDNQWKALEATLDRAKGMEAVLKQQGLIDDE